MGGVRRDTAAAPGRPGASRALMPAPASTGCSRPAVSGQASAMEVRPSHAHGAVTFRHVCIVLFSLAAAVIAATWALSYRGATPGGSTTIAKLDDFHRRFPSHPTPKGWGMECRVGDRAYVSMVAFRGALACAHSREVGPTTAGPAQRRHGRGFSFESCVQRPRSRRGLESASAAADEAGRRQAATYAVRRVSLPFWALFAVCLAYPATSVIRNGLRRRRRRRLGLCVGCGYDLTGATEGRCPECGRRPDPLASIRPC